MIKAVIIENEKLQSDYLNNLLSKYFPEVDVLTICDNVPDGVIKVKELMPQLLFLDVELPPYTGFDLLEKTKGQNYEVIFTTSFNKYAVKAIKFCALDFIEKPFSLDDLRESIERYKNKEATGSVKHIEVLLNNLKSQDKIGEVVGIPILGGLEFLRVGDIIYCKSDNNYTNFYLVNKGNHLSTMTLKKVEELFCDHSFFRVHDSYLINLNHIKSFRKGGVVLLTEKYEVDVSRRKKDDFVAELSRRRMIFN